MPAGDTALGPHWPLGSRPQAPSGTGTLTRGAARLALGGSRSRSRGSWGGRELQPGLMVGLAAPRDGVQGTGTWLLMRMPLWSPAILGGAEGFGMPDAAVEVFGRLLEKMGVLSLCSDFQGVKMEGRAEEKPMGGGAWRGRRGHHLGRVLRGLGERVVWAQGQEGPAYEKGLGPWAGCGKAPLWVVIMGHWCQASAPWAVSGE